MEEKLTTIYIFHNKTKPVLCGEGVFQSNKERMPGGLEDPVLCHGVLHLVLLDDHLLLEDLDGVQEVGRLLSTQNHLSKSPLAKNFEELKIFEGLKRKVLKLNYFSLYMTRQFISFCTLIPTPVYVSWNFPCNDSPSHL